MPLYRALFFYPCAGNFFFNASQTFSGALSEMSPPMDATSFTTEDETKSCLPLAVKNTVSISAHRERLVSAIWSSYSKSDMALKPLTMVLSFAYSTLAKVFRLPNYSFHEITGNLYCLIYIICYI